jgi:hypothetical protein
VGERFLCYLDAVTAIGFSSLSLLSCIKIEWGSHVMWIKALLVAGMQPGLQHASKGSFLEPKHSALLWSLWSVRLDDHHRRPHRVLY